MAFVIGITVPSFVLIHIAQQKKTMQQLKGQKEDYKKNCMI